MHRFRKNQNQKGFTMIELMVVVVIVGILAAIAIPLYGKYINNARTTEATARLGELVTAAKAWAQEHPSGTVPQWPSGDDGIFDITQDTQNFTYSITSGGGTPATGELVLTAQGTNNMAGAEVVMTVPDINSNGSTAVTLPGDGDEE